MLYVLQDAEAVMFGAGDIDVGEVRAVFDRARGTAIASSVRRDECCGVHSIAWLLSVVTAPVVVAELDTS